MNIKFADVAEERRESVTGCERSVSVITMTLLRLGYLIHSLDNRVMTLSTETGFFLETGIY